MDDLTSGFNIGTNYSLTPEFNEMIGFTEEEVRQMLTYYSTTSPFNHSVDELIEIMKPWYDNYCFAEECYGETTMYNSNMVLYFVKNYIQRGKAPRDHQPRQLCEPALLFRHAYYQSVVCMKERLNLPSPIR